jgi:hypothetical protein
VPCHLFTRDYKIVPIPGLTPIIKPRLPSAKAPTEVQPSSEGQEMKNAGSYSEPSSPWMNAGVDSSAPTTVKPAGGNTTLSKGPANSWVTVSSGSKIMFNVGLPLLISTAAFVYFT